MVVKLARKPFNSTFQSYNIRIVFFQNRKIGMTGKCSLKLLVAGGVAAQIFLVALCKVKTRLQRTAHVPQLPSKISAKTPRSIVHATLP